METVSGVQLVLRQTCNTIQYNTIQYNLFPPEVIPTVWLHTFAVSDDWYYFVQ